MGEQQASSFGEHPLLEARLTMPPIIARGTAPFFSICVLCATIGYAADAVDLKNRFLKEYPEAVKKLRLFYSGVQMAALYTIDGADDGKVQRRIREEYAMNGKLVMRKATVELDKFDNRGSQYVTVANPKRSSFSVRRKSADSAYALISTDEYANVAGGVIFDARPLTASFGFYEMTLWDSLHEESVNDWHVIEVVKNGQHLARVTWLEKADEDGNRRAGDVLVTPSQSWAIREFKLFGLAPNATRPSAALHGIVKYAGVRDGVPLVKTVSFWAEKYSQRGEVEKRWNVETYDVLSLKSERLPESAFRLTAFGLRDPHDSTVAQPARWWLWAAVVGIGLLVLGVAFYELTRRRGRR